MLFRLLLTTTLLATCALAEPVSLFDGKTFKGWEGETSKVWRIVDGTIVGGSLEGNPQNEFLATRKQYRNFHLKLEYKLVGTEGFVNGGVQFRSTRIENPPNEMIGYQADIGAGYSGCLYDESRRKKMLATAVKEVIERAEKPGEWNTYEIIAEAERIRLVVNGVRTVDYTERAPDIAPKGSIALQIHGKCKAEIAYRNITIEELPDALVPGEKEIMNRFGNPEAGTTAHQPFKDGQFVPEKSEVIVMTGQTNFVREQKSGDLESVLTQSLSAKEPRFRSMAWEGDTVYEQWRDLNFGDWKAQLQATDAGIVIAQFGQVEAFDGKAKLAEFTSAYHRLLDQFSSVTPRLVLVGPMPFEKPTAQHAPDLTLRNDDVALYANAVRDIARQRGAIYVDLFTPLSERNSSAPRLTDNGLHLNAEGLKVVARLIASQLGVSSSDADDLTALKEAIVEKNRLWFDCWRPANWSFVYGDRVTQMFGKPSANAPSLRESFESHKPLVANLDARIHAIARGETPPSVPTPPPLPPMESVLTAEQQLASFTLAEGYEINLFASEAEDVAKPTQFSWDERGRLYVACSPTYPQTLPGIKPSDYILILEDTDHDGKADKSTRFAEGLTMVQGVEPGDGGVYVCDFDQILHLKDTDGDGKADVKTVLYSGFGIGDTHQLVNSICHGPDGSLWFTQGLHAYSRVETPNGLAVLEKAGVWQYNKRTQKMSAYFNGGKAGHNCWGVAFDDYNQVFHKSGDRPAGYFSTPGLIAIRDPDEYHPTGMLFDTSPKTNSIDIIGTQAMPKEIQGTALIGGYFGNVVELHRFEDAGSGFKTTQLPKLLKSSDTSFRPVDVSVGPDGALYLCDWFNPVIGHYQASYADPRRDRHHGRIWRITAKGHAAVKQPALAEMRPAQLLEQLASPERWTRYQAKRLLFDGPTQDVLAAADAFIAKTTDEHQLMDVCGIYEAHETANAALLNRLLQAKDFRVRAYGTRVIGAWADRLPDALVLLAKSANDEHPRVRLEAVVASARVPKAEAVEIATQVLDHPMDKFIDYALKQAVKALQPQWHPVLAKLSFGGQATHAEFVKKIANAAPVVVHPGKAIYDALCLNCHQPEGKGLPGVYPSLVGCDWVQGDPARIIKIVLHGLNGAIQVNGQEFKQLAPLPMPPMGLDDQQTADVLTYIRANFGNEAAAVTADQVKAVRAATSERTAFWTEAELK
ncbi:putative membrane-bound dehydrogenase domain-containing protein [Prosthecobacter debontii]|uniref:Putative membrane-bound dehydrogenase domain-containing protein n=1 Tax=Prosthecobacter debontii TaxID=48467 RepID=A0A1T4XGJ3_9BACT|nr:PVC-type heme-binding CxxCH protein [Prosthecobacter debontii]SKA88205.1 putative membrane-bound dehydrogenase domain-containing protein [Prosthecobacter debontii]